MAAITIAASDTETLSPIPFLQVVVGAFIRLLFLPPKRKKIKTAVIVRSVKNSIPMLNQIKMMEPSSAINVELGGSLSFLESIDAEVEALANDLGADIIFLLIDKWDADLERAERDGRLTADTLLGHYIRLKISLHHVARRYERDYGWSCELNDSVLRQRIAGLKNKTKEARRNYYVAKHRYEGEHRSNCSCRGCRCIGGLSA